MYSFSRTQIFIAHLTLYHFAPLRVDKESMEYY
jgi:hypothetical protein